MNLILQNIYRLSSLSVKLAYKNSDNWHLDYVHIVTTYNKFNFKKLELKEIKEIYFLKQIVKKHIHKLFLCINSVRYSSIQFVFGLV